MVVHTSSDAVNLPRRFDEPSRDRRGASSSAPRAGSTFVEPWVRRVREVDDATLGALMRFLLALRRIKLGVAGLASIAGASLFGVLPVDNALYATLLYGTLAATTGLPAAAIGGLAVRRLFLREARRYGLSTSTALLLLTRGERRARHLVPRLSLDGHLEPVCHAVRAWDEA